MELFNGIAQFLKSKNLFTSATMLHSLMKDITFQGQLTDEQQYLLDIINKQLGRPAPVGIPPQNQAIMQNLMTKLIANSKAARNKAVQNHLQKLFQIKPFQKMISCADQLFFDNQSMNVSSKIIQSSDRSDYSNQSSLIEINKGEESQDYTMDEINMSQVDQYQDDDDAGFQLYECREQDVHQVSKQLADKYGFPQRASYPKTFEKKTQQQHPVFFPPQIKFPDSRDDFYPKEFDGTVYDCYNLKIVTDRERTGFEEQKEFPIVMDSLIAGRYKVIEYLGSAAFSKAIQCLDTITDQMVCLKIIQNNKDYVDQSIDQIKLLLYTNTNGDPDQNNVLRAIDFFYHKQHLIIVTELLRDNLYEFYRYNREHQEEFYFTMGRLQKIAQQILIGLKYLHSLRLIHCDLKPENILIKSYSKSQVKIIDLGSSCYIHDHLSSYVQSRSYRAPEVIMGCKYDYRIDIWSFGCIMAQLWTGNVLFQNESVQGLLARIVSIMGPFPETVYKSGRHIGNYFTREKLVYQIVDEKSESPESSEEGISRSRARKVQLLVPKRTTLKARIHCEDEAFVEFIEFCLNLDKDARPTAEEALKHRWLTEVKYPDGL